MAAEPFVSVVIPTYNQSRYLGAAIDSVLAQDYSSLEAVVVDDGSTDETPSIIAGYGSRIVAIHQDNQGAAAPNRGITEARGKLICWLSSDDAFVQGKIRLQVEAFAADPGLGLCFTGYEVIDAAGTLLRQRPDEPWIHPDLFVSVVWRNPINGSTAMMPRENFDEVGFFDTRLRADVDGDMWLRVLEHHRARHIPGVHLRYRVHGAAMSANPSLMRASLSAVRLPLVRNGRLTSHLRFSETPRMAAAVLAAMSLHFGEDEMPELARALLWASLRAGLAPAVQRTAAREIFRAARRKSPWFRGPWRHVPGQAARRLWQALRSASRPP